jgi:hypothetical protein
MPVFGSIIKSAIDLRGKVPVRVNPIKAQKRVLRRLLRKALPTAFGEQYGFTDILHSRDMIKTFKEKVPIHDYNSMHSNWWYRALNGETYVCWPGKVRHFALSSGTSDSSSKYIPVTQEMLRAIKRTSTRQIFSLAWYGLPRDFYEKGILMLGGSTHLTYNGTYYEGDLSGITTKNIPFWFQHHYKPGRRISRERDWPTKLDEIVKNAPKWDIGVIVGVPAWLQILIEKILDHYKLKHIHEIWPNLSIFVHGGVSFSPYVKGFEKLLGRPIIYIETYLASEGFIGYKVRPNTQSMQLVINNGLFYEFVPFNRSNFDEEGNILPGAETLTIKEVEENTDYALLITTCAGAWRYLIGDTIRFTSKDLYEIIITGRTKHFLSLCGEHLSQDNMNRAISLLEEDMNIEIREFTVAGTRHESMFAHKWYLGTDDPADAHTVAEKIDAHLKVLNDDYRVERIAAIKEVFVEVLPTAVFYDWMRSKGKEGGQNKFPRVLKNSVYDEWLAFLSQHPALKK